MIKHFCDICGEEIVRDDGDKININTGVTGFAGRDIMRIGIEVSVSKNGTWNAGDFHKKCIVKIIDEEFA